MHDEPCALCACLAGPGALFEDDLWQVRPIEAPAGVAGWMLLIARRHVAGPSSFSDAEAAAFGPALRHFERVLERVTGAERIYTAALGEAVHHFHAHMVPRMPGATAKGWALFDTQRAAKAGALVVDEAEVARTIEAYRAALAADPWAP
jgi:diadenosine tetraphosphate (Ap4A) HIT family hydrolase